MASYSSKPHLQHELLSIDHNMIQDRSQLQRLIIEYKSIIQNKIKQINQLTNIRDKQYQQRQIILHRMEQNKVKNQHSIKQYQNSIYKINQTYEKLFKDTQEDKQKNKKSIEIQFLTEIAQVNKKIQDLDNQYRKLRQFQQLQGQYLNKIEQMKKQLINSQYEHHDNMNKQQVVQLKENNLLTNKKVYEINQTKKNAHSQALNKVSSQVLQNQKQNQNLKGRLINLQNELGKLKKQRNDILNKRKELKINICLNQEQLQQYKAVGSLQKAKIKAYKDKIQNLKVVISEQVSKKEKIIADKKKQKQSSLKTIKLKLFNLEKQKEQLKIKMEKMKLLGQTIIQQRAQVQQFFLMALQNCKKQVDEYENRTFKPQSQNKSYGQKVDIDQLLPKDKQRILTNLYTKLAFSSK